MSLPRRIDESESRTSTFTVCAIEQPGKKETTYVVATVARNRVIRKDQHEIHPMFARAAPKL